MFHSPFFISLKIALLATLLVFISGLFLAYKSLRWKKTRKIVDIIFLLPMVLPPTVIGFFLLLFFSKQYPFGQFLDNVGIQIIFSWWGGVFASFIVAFPLMYRSVQSAMEQMDENLCLVARTLGMKEITIFWKIVIPNCIPGIVSGILLAFTRAFGEFGATIMVAGNIPGKTQTISMAIYSAMQSGDFQTAYIWVACILLFSTACILVMQYVTSYKWKKVEK